MYEYIGEDNNKKLHEMERKKELKIPFTVSRKITLLTLPLSHPAPRQHPKRSQQPFICINPSPFFCGTYKGGSFSSLLGMKHLLMDIVYYYRATHFFSYLESVLWRDFSSFFITLNSRALNFCHGSNNNNSNILSSFTHNLNYRQQ